MDIIRRKAYAKINLSLDVLRKRADGYHDLAMVMQTIGVFDIVECSKRDDGQIIFRTDSGTLSGEDAASNLCVKAASLLKERFGCGGVDISLTKNIPIAAGLAGGSTDGAAVLKAVCALYGLGLTQDELEGLGILLGADVPFTLRGGTILCEGIGDIMTDLPPAPDCTLLLAKPDLYVSTGEVYGTLVLDESAVHPDAYAQADAIRRGDLHAMAAKCDNLLARVTEIKHPVIVRLRSVMTDHGALASIMSGSGPTVFGIFEDDKAAGEAVYTIKKNNLAKEIFVTHFIHDIEKDAVLTKEQHSR